MDGVIRRQGRDGLEERRLVRAQAVEADHLVGAVAGDETADGRALNLDVGDPEQRGTAAGEPEQALEAEREIEVPARVEAALRERVETGEPPLPKGDPGCRVAPDHHVGLSGGRGPNAAALARACGPPRSARRRRAAPGRWRRTRARRPGSGTAASGRPPRRAAPAAPEARCWIGERCVPTPRAFAFPHSSAIRTLSIAASHRRLAAAPFPQIASTNACARCGSGTR